MSLPFGATRSVLTSRYALLTPAGFVPSVLPKWTNAHSVIAISPQMGARFCQLLITLTPVGEGKGFTAANELFLYVVSGSIVIDHGGRNIANGEREIHLGEGGFAYIPPEHSYRIWADCAEAHLLLFERPYTPIKGVHAPATLVGHEQQVEAAPFMGDEGAMLKTLLPDEIAFDMAVNSFTFAPGATLPMVETHIMEHGLLLIQGQGIYRLDDDWYPVQQGDVIWMAPYCPQWFVATGKTPARYIYYKDVNRDPATGM